MSETPATDKIWDKLCDSWSYWQSDHAHATILEHAKNLEIVLRTAARWGLRSDGFSAEVSDSLRKWIDNGMKDEPPQPPEYYPKPPNP